MFALTLDQRKSRRSPDKVPELLRLLNTLDVVRQFERTAGDEVQGLVGTADVVVDIVARAVRAGSWWVGVGTGDVEPTIPDSVREARGPALVFARVAVERAHKSSFGVAVEGPPTHYAETAIQALAGLVADRSPEGHDAVAAMHGRTTQKQAARSLGISTQAMSKRLQVARWVDERKMRELAIYLLAGAESAEPVAGDWGQ